MGTIRPGLFRDVFTLMRGCATRQRITVNEFGLEGRGIKTETELTRFVLCLLQQHCRVRGMGSQSMNSVSELKPELCGVIA